MINYFTYQILPLNPETGVGSILNFFLYDVIKILSLLFIMISILGVVRSYLPEKKIKTWIENRNPILGHFAASLFGAITPFCSCSSVPIFVSFIKAEFPLGVAFSFLITSPILNEYLFVLMTGYFGIKVAIMYAITGILLGTAVGLIFSKIGLEKYLVKDLAEPKQCCSGSKKEVELVFKDRVVFGINEGASIVKKIWKWVFFGIAVGAAIHNYIPTETIQNAVGAGGIFAVPLSVLLGVPLYGSCAAIVPIAVVLFNKGLPLGTALAFMMAVSALSLPEAIILKRVMSQKLISIFFSVVFVGIISIGYLFNHI